MGKTSGEKAVLAGLIDGCADDNNELLSLNELRRLAETAGAEVVGTVTQRKDKPDPRYILGRGKILEAAQVCAEENADLLIFEQELTPTQQRNIEDVVGVRVIDRTQLILDIFAQRARTKEGKLQVELAQLNYLLPRLTGRGIEMSRLGGGIGTRGPGETKLELDRRRIHQRITDLKKALLAVKKHRQLHRKSRRAVPLPLVSLVGYTNAGKSTLLNVLTGASVATEDKLFATLDPTTRRVVLPNNETILLTDTVGFIQNLPHHLVAAFRATLEEVVEADLLLHVVDASSSYLEQQIQAVEEVLESIGAAQKPTILVLNKIDRQTKDLEYLANAKYFDHVIKISAKYQYNINGLLDLIAQWLAAGRVRYKFFVPFANSSLITLLHDYGRVLHQNYQSDGVEIEVEIAEVWANRVAKELRFASKNGMKCKKA